MFTNKSIHKIHFSRAPGTAWVHEFDSGSWALGTFSRVFKAASDYRQAADEQ